MPLSVAEVEVMLVTELVVAVGLTEVAEEEEEEDVPDALKITARFWFFVIFILQE